MEETLVPKGEQRSEGGEERLERNLRVWQTLKRGQRDEGGEEARVLTCVSG